MDQPSGRERQRLSQHSAAKSHGASMEFANQQIRPQSGPKFSPLSIKRIADPGAILINEYRIACNQHQIRVASERIQNRVNFVRQPKIILIAEKHNLSGRA
jgi:hypothetical protein